MLYDAKILNQFLFNVEGPVKSLLMECFMHEAGSGTERSTYSHLKPEMSEFSLKEIIWSTGSSGIRQRSDIQEHKISRTESSFRDC